MLETDYDCFPKSLHLILITQLQNGIYRSRHSWTINVTGITVSTTIEILLVSVQQILHARAYLHLDALVELEIVGTGAPAPGEPTLEYRPRRPGPLTRAGGDPARWVV